MSPLAKKIIKQNIENIFSTFALLNQLTLCYCVSLPQITITFTFKMFHFMCKSREGLNVYYINQRDKLLQVHVVKWVIGNIQKKNNMTCYHMTRSSLIAELSVNGREFAMQNITSIFLSVQAAYVISTYHINNSLLLLLLC